MSLCETVIAEVCRAFTHFAEQVFDETCRDQLQNVLTSHKPKVLDKEEFKTCLHALQENLQKITSSHLSIVTSTQLEKPAEIMDTDTEITLTSGREHQKTTPVNENLVQILASKAEVDRRIAAFISSKRSEVNDVNKREFCFGLPNAEEDDSCARVDSVFVSHAGSRSRLRVTRVFNTQGPQTQHHYSGQGNGSQHANTMEQTIEERLANAEQHLKMGKGTKADVFSRLKMLEERILFLEGLSPEYFQDGVPPPKRMRPAKMEVEPETVTTTKIKNEYESLSDINQRISILQAKLKDKMRHLGP